MKDKNASPIAEKPINNPDSVKIAALNSSIIQKNEVISKRLVVKK